MAHAARVVVLPDNHYEIGTEERRNRDRGCAKAAEIFLGRKTQAQPRVSLPGRLERRGRELWDGAHTPAGTAWLRERIDEPVAVAVASILADKDADAMLHDLAALRRASSQPRPTIRARYRPSNSPREPSRTFRKSRSSPTRTARSRVRDNPVPG